METRSYIQATFDSSCTHSEYKLLALGLRRLLLVVEEDEGEEEHADHHGERAHVVRVRAGDEPLVLRVLQRAHRHLVTRNKFRM